MLSKMGAGKQGIGGLHSRMFLSEIEAIGKALYLDNNPSKSLISSGSGRSRSHSKTHVPDPRLKPRHGSGDEDSLPKDKRSIWNWRPLKALSRSRRFECSFYVHVHSIEGLPSGFNGASFRVHWKRRGGQLVTSAAKVSQGAAEFEEKLVHTCSVYGSRSGTHHSAKYDAKHFLLYATMVTLPELNLGKHRVDLTRLLPLTFEELEGEKSSGKWGTSYKLSGNAAGAVMNVSFGYTVIGDKDKPGVANQRIPELLNDPAQEDGTSSMRRSESLPSDLSRNSSASPQSIENVKDLHMVLPTPKSDLASSVITLYKKLDEDKSDISVNTEAEPDAITDNVAPIRPVTHHLMDSCIENGFEDNEFSVIEKGIELSTKAQEKSDEVIAENAGISVVESVDTQEAIVGERVVHDDNLKGNDICTKESLMKELESALQNVTNLEDELESDSVEDEENDSDVESDNVLNRNGKSLSYEDVTESEFLKMLGIENSPVSLSSESETESPREHLLREFEKDALASTSSLYAVETDDEDLGVCVPDASSESSSETLTESFGMPSLIRAAPEEHQMAIQEGSINGRAKLLEDLETEALMREWGLNENAFQYSPPKGSARFGSSAGLIKPEEPLDLPPLGQGLGPFLQTRSGGFVRTMNPSLFRNAKSGGSLIMQVSSPVVVPAEMGSGIMEILQGLASVGIEKLSMQASKLMPLEDITGKTMQQVAGEAMPALEGHERQCLSEHDVETGQHASHYQKRDKERLSGLRRNKFNSSSTSSEKSSEYVYLEDLAPLAMDKMEALSIEGLRIQSSMSDDEAPSNISAQSIGEISPLQGKGSNMKGSLGLEGASGLQLFNGKDGRDSVDGLMGLSLTLDEWMRLDSGEIGNDDEISERTTKILAAHHANSLTTTRGQSKGDKRLCKRKCGLLGNNFTAALMVQLRDPLRNYEPVGAPMLSLIQVERVFIPPKPRVNDTVSMARKYGEEDEVDLNLKVEVEVKEMKERLPEEEGVPQFKITQVHVAGLQAEAEVGKKKNIWGSSNQQKSGSRWLLANGMGKSNKNPFLKSKAVSISATPSATTKVQPGESLWSISSRVHGTGAKWKDLAALNPHIRNPNVIFPNETVRLC